MFVASNDEIVDCKENKNLYQFLSQGYDDVNKITYEEIEFDHLSFLLAKDMSYFKKV